MIENSKILEKIKIMLDSDAGLINNKQKVVDNRFKLIKQNISLIENKDDNFYSELISLISNYIDKLYDSKIDDFPIAVFDEKGERIPQEYDTLNSHDMYKLIEANRNLSESLFKYVCEILKSNKDVKLDIETLRKIFNRNPKLFTLSVEQDYLYRNFDFKRLARIMRSNDTLKKSNLNMDDIYQLLIDTCQLNNDDVFGSLVKPEDFKENHKKIDELLKCCNAKTFVQVTDIIRRNFDKDYDRLTIVKQRKEKYFCERILINMLKSHINESDSEFIHQILTDDDISIDYNHDWSDYFGQTSLRELLAFSDNRTIIKDLLSKQENIKNCYWHGDFKIQLYRLYAIIGDYQNALINFNENYNYAYDFTEDYPKGFNNDGYAKGDLTYRDSLVAFIENICYSLSKDGLDDSVKSAIISSILNSKKVQFINIDEILFTIQNTLSAENFKILVDSLVDKYNNGNLGFIVAEENDGGLFDRYIIRIATAEEISDSLDTLNIKSESSTLVKKRIPPKNNGNK